MNKCFLLSNEQKIVILDDILMGTFIIHRLINEFDRSVIEKACAEGNKTSLAYSKPEKLYW